VTAQVKAYLQNIVTFLRLHRAVIGGVSARATKDFELVAKWVPIFRILYSTNTKQFERCLAPMHSLTYVTPALVALAVRKVYPHRITITAPDRERSMQWGSDLDSVKVLLDGITPDDVIDEVMAEVEVPL
jgi:hypothetical protein